MLTTSEKVKTSSGARWFVLMFGLLILSIGLWHLLEAVLGQGLDVPIIFFGRVVDPNGTPLSGVQISARVRHHGVLAILGEARFIRKKVTSARDGKFVIDRLKGGVLTIETLVKDGYEAEPETSRSLGYNTSKNFVPDPHKPVEFRMWPKDQKREPLVVGDKRFVVIPDGRAYSVDLLKGEIQEGENAEMDLKIWIKRDAEVGFDKRFDWSFELSAINGGLLEEPDPYASMRLAPRDGYEGSYKQSVSATQRGWGTEVGSKRFYVRTRRGQLYGRIDVEAVHAFYLKDRQGRLWLKYTVNPSGSNILR